MNSFKLLNLKGIQDNNLDQQIITPYILNIPKPPAKSLSFKEYGELIKIKGFIVKSTNVKQLMDRRLELLFGYERYYNIPFSFLLNYNTKHLENGNCIIEFPHDYFLNHPILLGKMLYTDFSLGICNDSSNR